MPAWFINSGMLYRQAREAASRASTAGPRAPSEARIAVVFAFIAMEAFINELSDFANETSGDISLAAFGSLMKDLNDARASISVRFQFAKWILSREPFEKGRQPYHDFQLFIQLRNTIIHLPPDDASADPSEPATIDSLKFLENLRQKGLTRDSHDAVASFLAEISTPEMARWACDTAAAMVRSIVEVLPALPDSPVRFLFAKEFGL